MQKDLLATHPEVYADFDRWKDSLYKAYGDVGRAHDDARRGGSPQSVEEALAHREEVWKQGHNMLVLYVDGVAAEPRTAQATYMMALALHEQAERAQARADHVARPGAATAAADRKAAAEEARSAWKDAAGWWDTYIQQQPVSPFSLHARLLHARAATRRATATGPGPSWRTCRRRSASSHAGPGSTWPSA